LVSWSEVARSVVSRDQLASVVPGAIASYDLPDLVALLALGPLEINAPVDAAGRPVAQERAESIYAATKAAYAQAGRATNVTLRAGPPRPTRTPLSRAVDLSVGESQTVELSNGTPVTVKLLTLDERRDPIRAAIREATVALEVNGRPVVLSSGNYNLPVTM